MRGKCIACDIMVRNVAANYFLHILDKVVRETSSTCVLDYGVRPDTFWT